MNADHPLGKLLRLPLKLIPKDQVVPIFTRAHWGMRWIAGAGPHGCWLGIAETEKRERVKKVLGDCKVFYDLGANVGYYSLLAANEMKKDGRKIFAFEPSRRNLDFLKRHLALNHVKNVEIVEAAVSNTAGEMSFDDDGDPVGFRISQHGKTKVPVVSLDQFVFEQNHPVPDVIKIDTEGEEFKVLQGAKRLITEHRPTIFIETHDRFVPQVHQNCLDFLKNLSYKLEEYDGLPPTEIMATP